MLQQSNISALDFSGRRELLDICRYLREEALSMQHLSLLRLTVGQGDVRVNNTTR
ncbi:MAG: hypothetical protein R3E67_07460 [Pseudomonadales bacterium]